MERTSLLFCHSHLRKISCPSTPRSTCFLSVWASFPSSGVRISLFFSFFVFLEWHTYAHNWHWWCRMGHEDWGVKIPSLILSHWNSHTQTHRRTTMDTGNARIRKVQSKSIPRNNRKWRRKAEDGGSGRGWERNGMRKKNRIECVALRFVYIWKFWLCGLSIFEHRHTHTEFQKSNLLLITCMPGGNHMPIVISILRVVVSAFILRLLRLIRLRPSNSDADWVWHTYAERKQNSKSTWISMYRFVACVSASSVGSCVTSK